MTTQNRLIVGISGASGVVYGIRLLETLKALPVESHLVMSKSAELTLHRHWRGADDPTAISGASADGPDAIAHAEHRRRTAA